jgi:hypothetical protein
MISRFASVALAVFVLESFGRALGAPTISTFSPTAGAPGDQVQLYGSGFSSGTFTVRFWNGVVVTSGYVNSDSVMTVVVPQGISTGPISIQQGSGNPLYTADDFLAVGYGPYISDFLPNLGSVGDTVVISGVHLMNPIAVGFGGTSASEFSANADGTQITTRVPPGATNGPITVSTPYGTSNSVTAFTVVGPGPYIVAFGPVSGDTSTTIQITGLHFTGVTNVTFNGTSGLIVNANSDTLIQARPPSGVTTGPIAVYTPLGSWVTSSNFFGNPLINTFSPVSGRAGTNVLVQGTNFLGASAVYFAGLKAANFSVIDNSNFIATVPIGASNGLVRVVTPAGSAFSVTNFIVLPTLTGFSPAFGPPGTSVTITGANLNSGTPTVSFNGVPAATPTEITFGQLVAQVPVGASTGPVTITTADGSYTNASFFYLPATIASFTPTNSPPGGTIVIFGQNFIGASDVSFKGTPATSFTVSNNTSMSAVVPDGVITGPLSVTTPAGTNFSSGLFYGAPQITSFAPLHGLPGNTVTIDGVNFLGGMFRFGQLPAALLSLNNTQAVVTVPIDATTGPITVVGPAGTNTSTATFTLDYTSSLSVGITNSANPVTVGSNLVYTASIFNNGPFTAPHVTFTNVLPLTATLKSVSISPGWVLTTNGNILTGTATNVVNGDAFALIVTVVPQIPGTITSTISVSADDPDPVPTDNSASIQTIVQPLALLSIGALADQVKISWPLSLSNYALEFADDLSNAHWAPSTNSPTVSGGNQFIIETNLGPSRFYRLHR